MLCDPDSRLTAEQVLSHTWVANLAPNSEDSLLELDLLALKNYSKSNKFKKATLTFIASRLKDDEIHKLRDIFFSLDKNNDGTLTFEEMNSGCKSLKSNFDIEEIFNSIDTDKSGSINYTEFIAATIDHRIYLQNERLFEAFKTFDKDKSGKISMKEIHNVINDNREDYPSIEEEVKKFDKNGDGEIDYEEFCNMMGKINLKK